MQGLVRDKQTGKFRKPLKQWMTVSDLSGWLIFFSGTLLLVLVWYLDYRMRSYLPFSILFYLIPICLVSWFARLWQGLTVAVLALLFRFLASTPADIMPDNSLILIWNTSVRFVFFSVIVLLISSLKKNLFHEKHAARTDFLTGLENRLSFFETAGMEIKRNRRYKRPFTVVYIDVDGFKKINDEFGHAAGDKVLKIISRLIKKNIRDTDAAARLGGDEFALLLPETGKDKAQTVMRKFYNLFLMRMSLFEVKITLSMGAVTFKNAPESVDAMIKTADKLMYKVKKSQKNNIRYMEAEE